MGRKERREEGGGAQVLTSSYDGGVKRREGPLKGPRDNARSDCDSKSCIVLFNPARSWRRWKPVESLKGVAIRPF